MIPVCVAVVGALTVSACAQGQGGGATDAATYDAESDVTGTLEVLGFGLSDEVAETRAERAQEALSDVDVQLVEGGLDPQRFLTAVASGDSPDLIYSTRSQIGSFASRGVLRPLSSCLEGEGVDTGQYVDSALSQVTFDGEVYALPEFNVVQVLAANPDLLEEAGVEIPQVDGSDWEAIPEATDALKEAAGPDAIGYDSKLPEFFPLWARANGAELISEDGRTAQLDDPAAVEALELAVEVLERQGGFGDVQALRDASDFFGAGNQFASNTLGAFPIEQWYINVLNDVSPDAPVVFDTFKDRDGEAIAYASGGSWAIPTGSANPQAACRYAVTMTEVDSWLAAAEARIAVREEEGKPFTGLLTGNREADEQIRELVEEAEQPWQGGIEATYTANENTFSLPANPADAEFTQAWQDGVNRVLNGQAEPAESLARAQEEAQAALDEAWQQWDSAGGDPAQVSQDPVDPAEVSPSAGADG
ncbi:ABC transporter substrate-binding protein [Aquipuribacter sp. SD81]|uniref:ABC transporter substrate-binding protein n=1 Tax=Aquipuribacter sp. SD81 TaxID=3127703 RepID=UPI0030199264